MPQVRVVAAGAERAHTGRSSGSPLPTAGRGGGAGARARVTPTADAGQPQRLRGSYCARGGTIPCHRSAWWPLARSERTQGDPAALRCPVKNARRPQGGGAASSNTMQHQSPAKRSPSDASMIWGCFCERGGLNKQGFNIYSVSAVMCFSPWRTAEVTKVVATLGWGGKSSPH
jgi:hypothetical protein